MKPIRGQLSVELLAILGLMLALITPALFFAYTKSAEASQGFAYTKGSETLERLATLAAMVATSGEGSAVRARLEVPAGAMVRSTAFTEGSVLELSTDVGTLTKIVPYRVVMEPMEGGIYTIVVENKGSYIEIRPKEG